MRAVPRAVLRRIGIEARTIRLLARRDNVHWVAATAEGRVVLRRYAPDRPPADIAYELRLLDHLHARGWPVAPALAPPIEAGGSIWCAFLHMPGRAPAPRSPAGMRAEQRARGRLLAQLHAGMADLAALGQRPGWLRADQGLRDRTGQPTPDAVLRRFDRDTPEQGRILLAYARRMRERFAELLPHAPAPIVIHGDLAPWNTRYLRGGLSAILDFDLAHLDLRIADFALSWRGRYDEVLRGYEEVSPLQPVEHALLLPVYWAWVIASAVGGIEEGHGLAAADWAVRHLLRTDLR